MKDTEVFSDQYHFDFLDAIHAYKFDEIDSNMPFFHGVPMKAVDVVVEFPHAYVFVEVKHYDDQDGYDPRLGDPEDTIKLRRQQFRWLKNYLKYKFRDTYLFRHAEGKVDKEVHYICLVNFETPLNNFLMKQLKPELPVGKKNRRWQTQLAKTCAVVNLEKWRSNFPRWTVNVIEE